MNETPGSGRGSRRVQTRASLRVPGTVGGMTTSPDTTPEGTDPVLERLAQIQEEAAKNAPGDSTQEMYLYEDIQFLLALIGDLLELAERGAAATEVAQQQAQAIAHLMQDAKQRSDRGFLVRLTAALRVAGLIEDHEPGLEAGMLEQPTLIIPGTEFSGLNRSDRRKLEREMRKGL